MLKNILILVILLFVAWVLFYGSQNVKQLLKDDKMENMAEEKNSEMLAGNGKLEVKTEEIVYFEGAKGLYAEPVDAAATGNYPGVVMIHEWWGLNQNIKDMAGELAKNGYRVLAVDLFGKVATTPDEARAQTSSLDKTRAIKNLQAATAFLRKHGSPKIASLGWCFGGGQSLRLALSGEKLDATVIYYGQLIADKSELQKIKWPVLGIFGGKDQSIPVPTVNTFKDALTFLGVANSVHVYENVGHAFANPSGQNYAPEETKDAWFKTLTFLKKNLK